MRRSWLWLLAALLGFDVAIAAWWFWPRGETRYDAEILKAARRYRVDPALVKALVAYGKENHALQFKAGVVEGRVIDVAGINRLATLPGRDELFAKVLYMINAPAQRLATVINATARNLAVVVDQGVKENKFSA